MKIDMEPVTCKGYLKAVSIDVYISDEIVEIYKPVITKQ